MGSFSGQICVGLKYILQRRSFLSVNHIAGLRAGLTFWLGRLSLRLFFDHNISQSQQNDNTFLDPWQPRLKFRRSHTRSRKPRGPMANPSESYPCTRLSKQRSEDAMQCDQCSLPWPYSSSIKSYEEGDRGRLLTRIPGKLRSPGRPRTLRHTGPSIHLWLQRNNGSPVRNSPRNSSFGIIDNALDSRSSQQRKDRDTSPLSRSSLHSALSASSDLLGSANPAAAQRKSPRHPAGNLAGTSEHLSLYDEGVTVTRILSISPDSPNQIIRHYDADFLSGPTVIRAPQTGIPRRPTPVTAGTRYTALWEWVCSDSVSTSRIEAARYDIPSLPGRFVEYENFAIRYARPDSMSRGSNAAADLRTEFQS